MAQKRAIDEFADMMAARQSRNARKSQWKLSLDHAKKRFTPENIKDEIADNVSNKISEKINTAKHIGHDIVTDYKKPLLISGAIGLTSLAVVMARRSSRESAIEIYDEKISPFWGAYIMPQIAYLTSYAWTYGKGYLFGYSKYKLHEFLEYVPEGDEKENNSELDDGNNILDNQDM